MPIGTSKYFALIPKSDTFLSWQAMNYKSSFFPMDFGDLLMKPNYEEMSTLELTAYVLAHREDIDAIDALVNRRTPDSEATWYPAPCTPEGIPIEENLRIMEDAIRQKIDQANKKKSKD
jgi:hypothetical protein